MVVNKRKKVGKYRAHTTHGGGHRKKRRGAGSRGGRGNAGTGKRAGHKKAGLSDKLGSKKGFIRRRTTKSVKSVNVGYFTVNKLEKLLKLNKVTKDGDSFSIDLPKLGYQKLLGSGQVSSKLIFKVDVFTEKAVAKIKAKGGEVLPIIEKKKEAKS